MAAASAEFRLNLWLPRNSEGSGPGLERRGRDLRLLPQQLDRGALQTLAPPQILPQPPFQGQIAWGMCTALSPNFQGLFQLAAKGLKNKKVLPATPAPPPGLSCNAVAFISPPLHQLPTCTPAHPQHLPCPSPPPDHTGGQIGRIVTASWREKRQLLVCT